MSTEDYDSLTFSLARLASGEERGRRVRSAPAQAPGEDAEFPEGAPAAAGQRVQSPGYRKLFVEHVLQEGGKRGTATRADLVRMVRSGTVVAVQHLHLLADPKAKRKRGGTRSDLWKAVDAIEQRGGVFWELYTGLRSDTREGRDAMTRAAVEALARGRHKTSAADKRGRPKNTFTDAQIEKARAVWESRKYKTWNEAVAKLPVGMKKSDAYRLFGKRGTD